nr:MAG TPA: hypothetical protein [Caudoviricetes sp.]
MYGAKVCSLWCNIFDIIHYNTIIYYVDFLNRIIVTDYIFTLDYLLGSFDKRG